MTTKTLKFPCVVCLLENCAAPDCPAANGQASEYEARLQQAVDREMPPELEDEGDINF
jgi:hypothetical protein